MNVSDFMVERLKTWGVKRIYGYAGDGINGLMGAVGRAKEDIEFIQARHEELAAFMACAHAKFTGEVGVCLATSGPGAIHLLNGLYDAKMDHVPVVAIVGQSARAVLGGSFQQEVDLHSLFKDVASEFITVVTTPAAMRHAVDRAFRIAKAERTVTCIIVPKDLQEEKAQEPPRDHDSVHSGSGYIAPHLVPESSDLERAAAILNKGTRVAILAGAGALGASDELSEVADLLGAGVAKALLGKAVLPDALPYVTGSIGLLGTKPSWDLMEGCDTLLMIGSSFPYTEFLPEEGQARGVQIDVDPRQLSLRYPMELGLTGDAKETLRALIPLLVRKTDRSWRGKIEKSVASWWQVLEKRAMNEADPINPQRVFWELSPRLPDNCILACDTGTAANWYARDIKMRAGMMGTVSGGLATMGPAVPYAIAAKFAFPGRVAIATVGDGAMQMNGNASLITVSKYWQQWADPRLIVLVLNNRDLNFVSWEERVMSGEPRTPETQNLPDFPYARYAELLGLKGIRVDSPEQIGPAWDAALRADRPVVVEAIVDPNVPPLPPHITMKQAKGLAAAVLKGDADSRAFLRQSFKEMLADLLPGS